MAQNEQLEIGIVAQIDTASVESGLAKINKEVSDLGATAETTFEKKFANKIQRAAIELESAGSKVKKLQLELAASPVSTQRQQVYGGLLEELGKVEQGSVRASDALGKGAIQFDKYGLSAKQTAAALRQVPAQFTDIIVSLQGGQAPLTVLLQQGGQLKDVFGGVGNAARALGNYIFGLVNPFTVAIGAVAGLTFAFVKGAKENEAFNKTLILSNNILGTTSSQLNEIAIAVDKSSSAVSRSQAAEFINSVAGSSNIAVQNLERFTLAALEFERVGGGSAKEVAKNFAALADEPTKASVQLNKQMNYLTFETYKQIKAFEEQGRITDAVALAQKTYAEQLERLTPKVEANLGLIEKSWIKIKNAASEAISVALSIGRTIPEEERAKSLRAQAANLDANRNQPGFSETTVNAEIKRLLDEADALEANAKASLEAAQAKAKTIEVDRAKIAAAEALKQSLDSQTASVKASIEAAKLEQTLLADRGLDAEKILSSEKKLLELQQQRSAELNPQKQAVLDTLIGYQKQLVILDKINQATRSNLEAEKERSEEAEKQADKDLKREIQLRRKLVPRVTAAERETSSILFEGLNDPEKYAASLAKLTIQKEEWLALGVKETDVLKAVELQQKKLFEQYTDIGKVSKEFAKSLSQGLEDAIISGKNFSDILKQIEQDILRIITRQLITQPFEKAISDLGFSFFGGGTQSPAPITSYDLSGIPGRASGGPVTGSTMYLVGEKGPELFVPSTSGSIIPNDQMSSIGGSTSVNVSNVFYLANATDMRTQQQIAAQTGMSVQRAMARNT